MPSLFDPRRRPPHLLPWLEAKLFYWLEHRGLVLVTPPGDASSLGEMIEETFSPFVYELMNQDKARNDAYADVLVRSDALRGKRVLDIGTGATLTLSMMAMAGRPARIDAIEAKRSSFEEATAFLKKQSRSDRECVHLHHGFSSDVTLPERAEVLIHELIGTIASAEGVAVILADAQERLLTPDARIYPMLQETRLVPVCPPALSATAALISRLLWKARCIEEPGVQAFSLAPRPWWLSSPAVVETLDARPSAAPMRTQLVQRSDVEFVVERDGEFAGFMAACRVDVGPGARVVNALEVPTCWGSTFLRVLRKPQLVRKGEVIRAELDVDARTVSPSYTLTTTLPDGRKSELAWQVTRLTSATPAQ